MLQTIERELVLSMVDGIHSAGYAAVEKKNLKNHFEWNSCHVFRKRKDELSSTKNYTEVTCKLCTKLNEIREQDPVISLAHNFGYSIMKLSELNSCYLEPDYLEECKRCEEKKPSKGMYVFQSWFTCADCVRRLILDPENNNSLEVICEFDNAKFKALPEYTVRNMIYCPCCMRGYAFNDEMENQWDEGIMILSGIPREEQFQRMYDFAKI